MYIYKIDGYKTQCQTESINQPKVLTSFNASPPTYSTTVQERRKTLRGGRWSQISNFNSTHFPVTAYRFGIYNHDEKTQKTSACKVS